MRESKSSTPTSTLPEVPRTSLPEVPRGPPPASISSLYSLSQQHSRNPLSASAPDSNTSWDSTSSLASTNMIQMKVLGGGDPEAGSKAPLTNGIGHSQEGKLAARRWEHREDAEGISSELQFVNTRPLAFLAGTVGLFGGKYNIGKILVVIVFTAINLGQVVWPFYTLRYFADDSESMITDLSLFFLLFVSVLLNQAFGTLYYRSDHLQILIGRITALPYFSSAFQSKAMCWKSRTRFIRITFVVLIIAGISGFVGLTRGVGGIISLPLGDVDKGFLWLLVGFGAVSMFGVAIVICLTISTGVMLQRSAIRQLARFFRKLRPDEFCLDQCIRYYNQLHDILESVPVTMPLFLGFFCGLSALSVLIFIKAAITGTIYSSTYLYAFPAFFFFFLSFTCLYQMGLVDSEHALMLNSLNEALSNRASSCTDRNSGHVFDPAALRDFMLWWDGLSTFIEKKPLRFVVFGQPLTAALVVRILSLFVSAVVLIFQSLLSSRGL